MMKLASKKVKALGGCLRIACAFVVLVGPTAALLDEIVHRHAVCAEHGDLVHVDAQAAPLHNCASEAAGLLDEGASLHTIGEAPGNHDHEHCLVALAAIRKEFVQSRIANAFAPVVASASVHAEIDLPRISSISLIALAPKNSPPSA